MPRYYLRIDLDETLPDSESDDPQSFAAHMELMDFIRNEFDNQDIQAHLTVIMAELP